MKKLNFLFILLLGFVFLSACTSKYTITFVTYTDEEIEPIVYVKGDDALQIPTPEREGYDFKGWYLDKDFTEEFDKDLITRDLELHAKWEVKTFTVKFMDGTKEISSVTVEYGKDATAPTPPEKEGHEFTGWDKEFKNVKQNLVVYATYEGLTYEVVFMDGDQQIGEKQIVEYGKAATAPEEPTKEGHDFVGWDVDFSNVTEDLVVKAKWEVKTFTVVFLGQFNMFLKEEIVNWNEAATAPEDPVYTGYTFIGWDKDFSKVTENMTVNAQFEIIEYTIEYYDGETKLDLQPATYTVEDTLSFTPYEKEGFLFVGWYDAPDFAGNPVTGYEKGNTGNLKLYAKLLDASVKHTLAYELNGGMWGWTVNEVTAPESGIKNNSNLPVIFMQDFFTYLKDNDLLESDVVAASLRKTTWETFSVLTGDPQANYSKTTSNTAQTNDGYTQFFVDGGSGNSETGEIEEIVGGFFGADGYREKYQTLAQHISYMLNKRYTSWNTFWTNVQSETLAGFVMDGYFYGTQGLSGQDASFVALRGVIPTPDKGYRYVDGKLEEYTVDYLLEEMVFGLEVILPIPSREGYFFAGWYDNPEFNGDRIYKVEAGETPAEKYYAKWVAVNE